jgi:hypothetical protein
VAAVHAHVPDTVRRIFGNEGSGYAYPAAEAGFFDRRGKMTQTELLEV